MLSINSSVWPFTFLNVKTGTCSPSKHSYSQSAAKGRCLLLKAQAVEVAAAVDVLVLVNEVVDVEVVSRVEEQYPGISAQTDPSGQPTS